MSVLTRTLLVWLLALAIPLQGIAATAMLLCAPGHHSRAEVSGTKLSVHSHPSSTSGHGAGMIQVTGDSHGHSHFHADQVAVSLHVDNAAHHHDTLTKVSKATDGKCSACASCCTSTAMVSTRAVNPIAATGSVLVPFTLASFVSHIPLGFDPPPRAFLA